ncbi:LysR family transcriptional regulator [Shinella yambaruensis]|uniref:LysR family transcriptional regulator n=1 Tax=Shinella yambaruensis TaxID=415996 RepID=A0ABQ5ZRR2_9HYPH|nr:LysR family transcriptional regulator [Shinella yambaruensis]MCJ8028364.1 LysR family transcriptional regulator [Shinella yambaruensis]MCU7981417.1 LysR family transcriptional regulator [Shinella yambaruensis]GLR53553.1 LysR family transcriptional regulator [Shinella yambaruensis]
MSDRWQELIVFARVAESGSFSRAARELQMSQPSVSRIIGELEGRLGVKLLLRTTRNLSLTDAGALFLERARQVKADWESAEDAARGVDSLRGVIRLALPIMYGTRAVIPCLPGFLNTHPELRVEITMSDERQNLVTDGIDVAVRVGELDDSTFGSRRLASVRKMVVAAPSYLEQRGVPKTPADLAKHECILGHGGFGRENWRFRHNETVTSVNVQARFQINSAPGILASAVAGLGIGMVSDVMAVNELRTGQVVELLPEYEMDGANVYAVLPAGPRPSAKVKALIDFLGMELARHARDRSERA